MTWFSRLFNRGRNDGKAAPTSDDPDINFAKRWTGELEQRVNIIEAETLVTRRIDPTVSPPDSESTST